MSAFKKILVPVDFSDGSAAAVQHAVTLAKNLQAEVDIVHAFDVPTFIPPHVVVMMGEVDAPLSEHAERHAKEQLEEFIHKMNIPEGVKWSSRVLLGPPAVTVLEAAEQGKHDLIVMGTHGRTGLPRLVMGSVAEKIVRNSSCPVLTVRADAS
jgi:nucleotide-binding universal stress UspA family protein